MLDLYIKCDAVGNTRFDLIYISNYVPIVNVRVTQDTQSNWWYPVVTSIAPGIKLILI